MTRVSTSGGWKSFESCTRQQLLTTAYALEDTRDRALAENAVLRAERAQLIEAIMGWPPESDASDLTAGPLRVALRKAHELRDENTALRMAVAES